MAIPNLTHETNLVFKVRVNVPTLKSSCIHFYYLVPLPPTQPKLNSTSLIALWGYDLPIQLQHNLLIKVGLI